MQWMDYSPGGVLGLVWRTPTEPHSGSLGAFFAPALPYDIWTAISRDGGEQRFFEGCFGIFGHGNVAGMGQALEQNPSFPYYLCRNEHNVCGGGVPGS